MKFYSSTEKPNIYSILYLTLAVTLLLIVLDMQNVPGLLLWANAVMMVYFALVVLLLFTAFRKQIAYNPYSYNTILYSGFGFFMLFMVWNHLYMLIQSVRNPVGFGLQQMFFTLLNSGKNYLLLTMPLLAGTAIALLVSNIILVVSTRDFFFHNSFGFILSFLILAGLSGIGILSYLHYTSGRKDMIVNLFLNLIIALFLYFECMLTGTVIADLITANYHPEPDKDFLIVLGCGLEKDGTPTPLLQKRLNTAISFADHQERETGKEPVFVVSGGKGADECQSEASSMKNYLQGRGIPAERIIMEDQSVNTHENMLFSKDIIMRENAEAAVAFVTTKYHVFRAGVKANRIHMKAVGIGSPARWFYWPSAAMREFVGLMAEQRKKHAMVLIGLILFYSILTFLASRPI